MKLEPTLGHDDAAAAIDAIRAELAARGRTAVIAVADAHGELVALARLDGAPVSSVAVATAKARCSEAALVVSELAHAIHGAIGFTAEYDLQLYTRRLHAWRQAAGSESYWHDVAGSALLEHQGLTLDMVRRITDVETML